MDDKSLEIRYDSFTNQYMSSIYLLKRLGFDKISQINDTKMKQQLGHESYWYGDCYINHHSDSLYRSLDDMNGLNDNSSCNNDSGNIVYGLLDGLKGMIDMKLPFMEDLLVFAFIISNYCITYDGGVGKQNKEQQEMHDKLNKMSNEFIKLLEFTIEECLSTNARANTDDSKDIEDFVSFKERNYQWFKEYLLHSNLWLVKTGKTIFFERGIKIVKNQLLLQKKYIWKHVEDAQKYKNKLLLQLCEFGNNGNNSGNDNVNARQDKILDGKGIMPQLNELETILMKLEMADESRKDFDVSFENNTKIYLTQCLTFAHSNNSRLQNGVKKYFESNPNAMYQSAPVKLYDRCVIKATSDYSQKEFPSVANIIDFLRFSVTFNTIEQLLSGINKFINDINSGVNENLQDIFLANGILRIKNGFSNIIKSWKSYQDAEYCDIKLNLIYTDSNGNGMIVEAQFLLKFLLKAKKMGHKLYALLCIIISCFPFMCDSAWIFGVLSCFCFCCPIFYCNSIRQEEFISNVSNQIYIIDENYDKYKFKINNLIENGDTRNLTKQLFWKPNIVLSIVNYVQRLGHYNPLLYLITKEFEDNKHFKFILFFINCLFHLSYIMQ